MRAELVCRAPECWLALLTETVHGLGTGPRRGRPAAVGGIGAIAERVLLEAPLDHGQEPGLAGPWQNAAPRLGAASPASPFKAGPVLTPSLPSFGVRSRSLKALAAHGRPQCWSNVQTVSSLIIC